MAAKKSNAVFNENDLVMYLALVLKHLRLMSLLICFCILLGLAYYLFCRSLYKTSALIHMQTIAQQVSSENFLHDSMERVVFSTMRGPEVSARVAKRLGLPTSPRRLAMHLKQVRIYRIPGGKDIMVDVYAYSYPVARDWAKVMLEEYLIVRDQNQMNLAEAAIKAYSDGLADLKERINTTLDKRFDFRQTNELSKLLINLNGLREVPSALVIVQHRLRVMDQIKESLRQPNRDVASRLALLISLESDASTALARKFQANEMGASVGQVLPALSTESALILPALSTEPSLTLGERPQNPPSVVVLPSMVSSPEEQWKRLEKERTRIQQELDIKGRTFLPGHPQMAALRKQLDEIDRGLELEFEHALNGFNIEYANLTERKGQLERKLPEFDEVSRRQEKLLKEYGQLDAGQRAWNNIYNNLARRLSVLDYGVDRERNEFEYVGLQDPRNEPISPLRSKLLMYGFLLGMALSIGIPFLLEYLNTRISDIEHAEESLAMRGLGVVPKIVGAPFESMLITRQNESDYHLKENFRLIRTNLIINSENAALPQVILVTSAMPQEGKTCVAANLALSFANKGEKTLLIDGDLRRGRLYKVFDCPNKPGLSNLLKGEATLEQTLRVNGVDHFTLLPCGKHLNSASELLDSHRFTDLMAELRGKYQRIILDSPPVLGLSETIIMQRAADGILLVIWSGFTTMSNVKSAVQSLQINGGKFLGFVLNRLDFSALDNRYKYFYYAPIYYTNYQPLPAPPESVKDSIKV
jgi:succinoglycan biosynthesis transport protein ExoP